MSPPESFSFLFPLYPVRFPASLGTPCPFLTKEKEKEERGKRKEERGKRKEGGITLGCTRLLRSSFLAG
jgi:hypothetical protein